MLKKISAILPVYNRERFLGRAVESVLDQSYANIELIIVDDGSTDDSLSIARAYAAGHPERVTVLSQENGGPSRARNHALRHARGELVAFIDSDDLWAREKVERQVGLWDSLQGRARIGFIYSGYFVIDEHEHVLHTVCPDPRLQGDIAEKLWTIENHISGGTILAAKDALLAIGGFDEELRGAENLDLRLRLSRLGEVHFQETCLYYYRKHGSNLTSQSCGMNASMMKLIDKHFADPCSRKSDLYRRVIAKHNFAQGVQKFSRMELAEARPYFWRALKGNPASLETYLRLVRCCLGTRVNSTISDIRGCLVPRQ